ncbi:glycosyltransferase family 4 protein [Patescibacteria group bacterium]|nr:glycosyltransferase family 4 protein [Patescibacteria group bacterium]
MLIGIDGNEANVEKKVGIGEYAFELLKKFEESKVSNFQFLIYLKDFPREDLPKAREGWRYRVVGPRKMWTQFALPRDLLLKKPRADIFFTPSHYAPRFSPIPTAISIMDLSYIYFPQLFKKNDLYQLKSWTKYSAKKASLIFTISNSSKDDIIKEYKIDPKKVVVTYPGIKDQKFKVKSMENLPKKYEINKPYFLFIGTIQPRKNIAKLIEAFASIKEDVDLVVIGKKGWLFEQILAAPSEFGVEKRVKFLDFVPNEDLPLFYQNAVCYVLPSLYEGFGLPVLEAMQNNCPVITSNVSSLPEAGGDAAIYVNPEDVNDIKEKMEKVLRDSNLREEMIKKGQEQVKKFSWEKTAKETLKALETLKS